MPKLRGDVRGVASTPRGYADSATTQMGQGAVAIWLRPLLMPAALCSGGDWVERPEDEERQRAQEAQGEAQGRGKAVPHLRPAHRLQPAGRAPVELRGGRDRSGVARRQPARLLERGRRAPDMQPAEGKQDARRRLREGSADSPNAPVLAPGAGIGGVDPSPGVGGPPGGIRPISPRHVAEHRGAISRPEYHSSRIEGRRDG